MDTNTIFTDDDLHMWKATVKTAKMEALLIRLEAAEKIKSSHAIYDCACNACIAWEKASGR